MGILEKKTILTMDEGMFVSGYGLVQNYSLQPQKNGGSYISGQVQLKGQVPFKVWSNTSPNSAYVKMTTNPDEYKNSICQIRGKVDRFGGISSIIIDSITAVDPKEVGLSTSDFLEEIYDINAWWSRLEGVLRKNCSEAAVKVFEEILLPIKDKFVTEFAASFHHDNCKSGLLAHTTKVVRLATVLKMYPEITAKISSDALFLGCALHDIGKVFEYSNGTVSGTGKYISHHTFGVMLLIKNESLIVNAMGEDFYYSMLSVVEQHHGEYAERPRTVLAYVIYLLDNLDSTLTSLDKVISEAKDEQIQYNGYKLV